ncbi:MAG: serine/threonine-protein kinase [Acidobacteriota bacterium]
MSQRRALELLPEALALDGEARRAFVEKSCGSDGDLKNALAALIIESQTAWTDAPTTDFLTPSSSGSGAHSGNGSPDLNGDSGGPSPPGAAASNGHLDRLGPYRLLARLGEGGMGTVYLAEQEKPIERRVALKVLRSFTQPRQAERFALEGQVLARLSHPHVASLYEVGETDDGHPFVAMEVVEGQSITAGCDARRLDLRARIELFCGACAGVSHAHQKGVLHRDLKPSNVLVTDIDGRPVAKVIDFGIARSLDPEASEATNRITRGHQLVGSPIYMSPEALLGEPDVDTRSDVYALGLILYELLTGALPFDLDREPLVALMHRITQGDLPTATSRYAGFDAAERERIAADRGTDGGALLRRLGGDFDAILSKALALDRDRRYSSPAELAEDLRRALGRLPVSARPHRLPYVAGRFLQRHLGMAVAVSALLLSLVGGALASAREARRASLEAERAVAAVEQTRLEAERARRAQTEAQEVSRFLVELFDLADPEKSPDEPVDARDLFIRGVDKLRTDLHDQPLPRARLLDTIAEIYTKMAWLDDGELLALEALDLRRAYLPKGHEDVLESLNRLGVLYRLQGRFDAAEPLLTRVVQAREAHYPPDTRALAQALNNLGNVYWNDGRLDEAVAAHQRALALREGTPDVELWDLAESLNNLGVMMQALQRYEEAEVYLRRADTIFIEVIGADHPTRAACLNNLGLVNRRLGHWDKAESAMRQAISIWSATYDAGHPRLLNAKRGLAQLFDTRGLYGRSVPIWRELTTQLKDTESPTPEAQIRAHRQLGVALARLGDLDGAATSLRRSLQLAEQHLEPDDPLRLAVRSRLGWFDVIRGESERAEREHRELLRHHLRVDGESHSNTSREQVRLAAALVAQGRDLEAEPHLRRALAAQLERLGDRHRIVADSRARIGELLARRGDLDEATSFLGKALSIYAEALPRDHPDAASVRNVYDTLEAP